MCNTEPKQWDLFNIFSLLSTTNTDPLNRSCVNMHYLDFSSIYNLFLIIQPTVIKYLWLIRRILVIKVNYRAVSAVTIPLEKGIVLLKVAMGTTSVTFSPDFEPCLWPLTPEMCRRAQTESECWMWLYKNEKNEARLSFLKRDSLKVIYDHIKCVIIQPISVSLWHNWV